MFLIGVARNSNLAASLMKVRKRRHSYRRCRFRTGESPAQIELAFGLHNTNPRFGEKVLLILISLAIKIALYHDKTVLGGLRASFPDINAADRLLVGGGQTLRTGPTIDPVSRFHLDAQ